MGNRETGHAYHPSADLGRILGTAHRATTGSQPNPAAVVGLRRVPVFPWGDIGIHFTAFTILTLLVYVAQWPKGIGWAASAVLVAYGITTESLQWFVPSRAVELLDYTENILGVAAGTGIYWLGRAWKKGRSPE